MASQLNVYLCGGKRLRLGVKAQDDLVNYLKDKLRNEVEQDPNLSQSRLENLGFRYVERWLSLRLGYPANLTMAGALNVASLVNLAVSDVLWEQIREGR